jgi:hypothetical protein
MKKCTAVSFLGMMSGEKSTTISITISKPPETHVTRSPDGKSVDSLNYIKNGCAVN